VYLKKIAIHFQIGALIKTRKERELKLDSILLLLIHTFSIVGPEQTLRSSAAEELDLAKSALTEALLEDCQESKNNWRMYNLQINFI